MLNLYGFDHTPVQMVLPGFQALPMLGRRGLGCLGENTVWQALEASGYKVQRARTLEGDLRAIRIATGEIYRVEVKTARRGKDGRWRFTLYKEGHTNHVLSNVVVLLAVLDCLQAVPFVVPVAQVEKKHHVVIGDPFSYRGWLAAYRRDLPLELEA